MGSLQAMVTWYKKHLAGEQAMHWDIQNKATSSSQTWIFFVLDVPVRNLLTSKVFFVPCDRYLQKAHFQVAGWNSKLWPFTLKLLNISTF